MDNNTNNGINNTNEYGNVNNNVNTNNVNYDNMVNNMNDINNNVVNTGNMSDDAMSINNNVIPNANNISNNVNPMPVPEINKVNQNNDLGPQVVSQKKSKLGIIILLGIIVIAGVVAFLLFNKDKGNNSESNQTTNNNDVENNANSSQDVKNQENGKVTASSLYNGSFSFVAKYDNKEVVLSYVPIPDFRIDRISSNYFVVRSLSGKTKFTVYYNDNDDIWNKEMGNDFNKYNPQYYRNYPKYYDVEEVDGYYLIHEKGESNSKRVIILKNYDGVYLRFDTLDNEESINEEKLFIEHIVKDNGALVWKDMIMQFDLDLGKKIASVDLIESVSFDEFNDVLEVRLLKKEINESIEDDKEYLLTVLYPLDKCECTCEVGDEKVKIFGVDYCHFSDTYCKMDKVKSKVKSEEDLVYQKNKYVVLDDDDVSDIDLFKMFFK